ncbi:hypothetical protein PF005_g3335 [Phytophthora fragariae]|uniref:Uncharacterized protein n=1 Tax=Phytophthora fragariae TaxID=53985 RepID=A0A6A3TE98_9STRA|nr:hypothetical protein PF009_g1986 [Phytophthora fragariae]KAE9134664.1 hypothetical protein PF007_g2856 [Phytophthora fragariae]KAE9230846.1 hypothetical protein PF005_g3335 [Phytophthora fragariae]
MLYEALRNFSGANAALRANGEVPWNQHRQPVRCQCGRVVLTPPPAGSRWCVRSEHLHRAIDRWRVALEAAFASAGYPARGATLSDDQGRCRALFCTPLAIASRRLIVVRRVGGGVVPALKGKLPRAGLRRRRTTKGGVVLSAAPRRQLLVARRVGGGVRACIAAGGKENFSCWGVRDGVALTIRGDVPVRLNVGVRLNFSGLSGS